jgi:uncharacterized protein YciI
MTNTYMILSSCGPNRDLSKDTREQAFWDDHVPFINNLIEEGFIFLGGPLIDEGGAVLVVRAEDEAEVRRKMQHDPWYVNGILTLDSVKRWEIYVDERQ